MAKRRRRGGRDARRAEVDTDPLAAPGGERRNLLRPARILSDHDVERIHEAALSILATSGVRFDCEAALRHFESAGLPVNDGHVRCDRDSIESALSTAPPSYTLYGRDDAFAVRIGGDHWTTMPAGSPAFIRDLDGNRRSGRLDDLRTLTRLGNAAPQLGVLARKSVEPADVPVARRHLEAWRVLLTEGQKPVQAGFVGGAAEAEDALEMLAICYGGRDAIRHRPVAQASVNVNSPRVYDGAMAESLIAFAAAGQSVLITPFVMAGVSGPVTLAGALAQQHAEILAGVVLTQLVRPGTPVLYGAVTSGVDLRSGAPATASPEGALCILASTQLARRIGLPVRAGGTLCDSPVPDTQSQFERMFMLTVSMLAGVNYVMHAAGMIESYLTTSIEQFVIDLELLDIVAHTARGIRTDDASLALEAIQSVRTGGMFLDAPHTLSRYRDAFFEPRISVRMGFEQWESEGRVDASARAREQARELIASSKRAPPLTSSVAERLDDFCRRAGG